MKKKAFLGIALIIVVSASMIPASAAEGDIIPAFYINLLSPNTNPARNQWAALMENQLPKIGIGISFHESTGWGNIMPRTWAYPVGEEGKFDYIPTYEEGGYDILFVGWSWGLDWDPTGLYDSASMVPAGDNMYQYSNPEFDTKLVEYTSELDDTARIAKAKELQAILYEDLPAITIIYPREVFGFADSLSGIDTLLLGTSAARPENWRNSAGNSITYALPAELTEYTIFVAESYYDMQWMQCVYYGLFGRSQSDHLMEPVLASNYSVSDDLLTFTVDLNPNAYFSNGDKVTAYDVDYTYELHMTPAVASSSYGFLTTFFEDNDSIVALDEDTVQFTLKQQYAFALSLFSYGIINKNLVSAYIADHGYDMGVLDQALVTCAGPFMLDVANYDTANSIVTLTPNPYWALTDDTLLDEIIFTWISGKDTAISSLADGTVDIVDSQYAPVESDYEGISGINVVVAKTPATQEMAINMKHPIIGTGELTPEGTAAAAKSIRKAISHAIPRDTIISEILQGLGAPGVNPMPDASVGFDTSLTPYTYDLELAKTLIEDAGYEIKTETAETGTAGLVFIAFLGIATLVAFRRIRK
ncbi:MAG: ABC transporter substrate-binding protein [Candidatus Heimdallarchaeaceae archaeon]